MEEQYGDEQYSDEQITNLTGISSEQLDDMMQNTEYGKQTMQFLAQWSEVTTLSLKANRLVLSQCLTQDDENRILCRFCGSGIPNWKQENSREHTSECPIVDVGEALKAVKTLQKGILGMEKNVKENPNPLSGRCFTH